MIFSILFVDYLPHKEWEFYSCFSGSHFAFGYGRLYLEKGKEIDLNYGIKLLMGADKGIRFIEGDTSTGIVPALVLDGMFFSECAYYKGPFEESREGSIIRNTFDLNVLLRIFLALMRLR